MKKSNRISRKAPTNRGNAQGGRVTVKSFSDRDAERGQPLPPSHRLAPRSREQAKGFRRFTENLGARLATSVLKCGNVEHLYMRSGQLFLVQEMLTFRRRGVEECVDVTLSESGESLTEFVKFHRSPFHRIFNFESVDDEFAAHWSMKAVVVHELPKVLRIRFWRDETLMHPLVNWIERGDGEPIPAALYNRGGGFVLVRNHERPQPITWNEAADLVHTHVIAPAFRSAVPRIFVEQFSIQFNSSTHDPATAADLV